MVFPAPFPSRRGERLVPQSLHPALWRAGELAAYRRPVQATGFAALDHELPGGGWPTGMLTEVLLARPGQGEMRLLAPALRALSTAGKPVVLVAPDVLPYAPAWAAWGIDLSHLVIVGGAAHASCRADDCLWAAEQALKSRGCGAVLAWLPQARPGSLRRLQLVAAGGDTLAWVFRTPQALACASPAPLRLELRALPGSRLAVTFHKRRGPARAAPLVLELPAPHPRAATRTTFPMSSFREGDAHALLDCASPARSVARSFPASQVA